MKQSAALDSSFWINAHRSGLLDPVLELFDLHYPPAVAAEMREEFASGREFWRLVRAAALLETTASIDRVKDFGPGEREAMSLAMEHPDWFLLVDDRRPLRDAQRLGIRTICTPVLVVDLYHKQQFDLSEALEALEALARLSALRTVSPLLIQAAAAQLEAEKRGREK